MDVKLIKPLRKRWSWPFGLWLWISVELFLLCVAFGTQLDFAWNVLEISLAPSAVISLILFIRLLFFRRFRRFLFWGSVGLAILVVVFYVEEDWRGVHAWNSFRREWEAKGETFDWQKMIPPPVQDGQNFALTPIVYSSYGQVFDRQGHLKNPPDTNVVDRLILNLGGFNYPEPSFVEPATWCLGMKIDLIAWQKHFQTQSDQANRFPISSIPETPAQDVLLALSRYNETLDKLGRAAQLPESRFPLDYDRADPFEIDLSHLASLESCSKTLSLRAVAELQEGRVIAAHSDVQLIFRLMAAIQKEPFLSSLFARKGMARVVLQPVWEGLADHRWSDDQLAVQNEELAKLNFVSDYNDTMHGEMAMGLRSIEYLRREPGMVERVFVFSFDRDPQAPPGLGSRVIGGAIPSGWFYQNQVDLADFVLKYIIPAADMSHATFSPTVISFGRNAIDADAYPFPYWGLARSMLGGLGYSAQGFAFAQASTDMARIAIALERYRLLHGFYPEKLDVLSQQFLAQIPHDPIGGQPFHYRLETNGQFTLYSIGWNEKDDGGTIVLRKNSKTSLYLSEGDWIWRYPSTPETGK